MILAYASYFDGNGFTICCTFTFQNTFTMTQNPKLVVKLGKNSTFYDFPTNFPPLGSQGKNFKHFGSQRSDLDMGKKTTCCLNTLYMPYTKLERLGSVADSVILALGRPVFEDVFQTEPS